MVLSVTSLQPCALLVCVKPRGQGPGYYNQLKMRGFPFFFFFFVFKFKLFSRCLLLLHLWYGKIFRIAEFWRNGKSDSFCPPFFALGF